MSMSSLSSSMDASPSSDIVPFSSSVCQICDSAAHGNHFGAITCRACAAFFRRYGSKLFENIPCREKTGKCGFKNGKRHACKKCRLERCYEAGMSAKSFQFHRDLISSTTKQSHLSNLVNTNRRNNLPFSLEQFVGRPYFLITCEPEKQSPIKEIINVQYLIDKAKRVFDSGPDFPAPNNLTSLEKLAYGLRMSKQGFNPIYKLERFGRDESFSVWEYEFLNIAKCLMYFDEFQKLPSSIKLDIIKSTWMIWTRFEKHAQCAQAKNSKSADSTIVKITDNCVLDLKKYDIDMSWFTKYTGEQLEFFMDYRNEKYVNEMVEPIANLNPTDTEVAFMLAHICFHFAGKSTNSEMTDITDRFESILADNLHEYYSKNRYLPNYASRLTSMLRIKNNVIVDVMQRRKKHELCRVFDLFFLSTTEPQMFMDVGF